MARKNKQVKPDQLAPKIAPGYTNTPMTPEEARREFPAQKPQQMGVSHLASPGLAPVFVAEDNGVPFEEPNTGRQMQDASVTRPKEHCDQIFAGYRCLWCGELHTESYPENCDVCGYQMRERQAVEARVEIAGETHIGPARGLAVYFDELREQAERREFDRKIEAGKSRMRGLH